MLDYEDSGPEDREDTLGHSARWWSLKSQVSGESGGRPRLNLTAPCKTLALVQGLSGVWEGYTMSSIHSFNKYVLSYKYDNILVQALEIHTDACPLGSGC